MLDRQLDALKQFGVGHIYNEKMTGTRKDRPELMNILDRITAGDTIIISSSSLIKNPLVYLPLTLTLFC